VTGTHKKGFAFGSLAVLFAGFIAAVIASNSLLSGIRFDLTENKLYTLSEGTRSMLNGLEEPINLYFFFSEESAEDIQILRDYASRVAEVLAEFAVASNGNLRLQIIDPVPFSPEEDRASSFGLTNLALGTGSDSVYFGLAATNLIGDEAVIDLFDPDEEVSLEYDLARLVYSLATPNKPVVGLLSGVPMSGGFDPQTQQLQQPWVINQHIQQLFEVRTLSADISAIDADVSLLWIVHPVNLPEAALYAIDQFILGGGRALIFVDPLAEAAASADPTGMGASTSSNLAPLFEAWGLEFDETRVVADNLYALNVASGGRAVRHVGILGLGPDAMAQDEIISAGLGSINLSATGSLGLSADAQITLVPLLESSTDSTLLPAAQFQFLSDPSTLLDSFLPDSAAYVIAARIEGPLRSAFPDGPPAGDDPIALDALTTHSSESLQSNVVVVADVDMLSDRLWVQMQRSLFGQQIASPIANNHDFVANAVANLAGSEDLIGLKSRQTFDRPFDRVQALRREADARLRATEQRLEAELAETERRLGELQSAREDQGSLLMNEEQQAELERFQQEQLRIRQELRDVQRGLNSSIENLGTALKLINIVVFPLGLALAALAGYLVRRPRKQAAAK
jgi:ABC-type uncharacterized transport system involved in gliding motility auxiliary subunit